MNRRTLLAAGAGLAAGVALGGMPARAQDVRMRCTWWGSAERLRRTNEVIALYNKQHPEVAITGEQIAGSDYWVKLATAMAGRSVSDVFQLEPSTLSDYSGRGACLPLDPLLNGAIDLSKYGAGDADLCRIDGKLFGVTLALNSFAMLYDSAALKEAGLEVPKEQMSWEAFAEFAKAFKANGPKKRNYWAAPYAARYGYVLDIWLRQRGKRLFDGGSIGFDVEDAKAWFGYWEDLRQNGACVSADIQTRDDETIETNALTLGNAAVGFAYSNQLVGYQKLNKGTLELGMVPGIPGAPSGHYYRSASCWSIGATTANAEAAGRFISFFVNDVEAGKILGVERGVPPSSVVREAILPLLDETEKKTVAYVEFLKGKVEANPPPAPIGANEFSRNVLRPTADAIAFEQLSIADGAQQLVENGRAVLRGRT
ncbi:carbohydrate ABC transporter substrate-binding protein [Aureimonas leprariae]|uniref:Carbohydrate ABC transporter substrate-binding protein n=2 Tax=Plantimonas leprariae TaxID=2615207 RepID=A0A7V7PRH9_9HYPH|nr:carbohydrate ABC transporter substrate-binding protein [Aureimonas leprariae]